MVVVAGLGEDGGDEDDVTPYRVALEAMASCTMRIASWASSKLPRRDDAALVASMSLSPLPGLLPLLWW